MALSLVRIEVLATAPRARDPCGASARSPMMNRAFRRGLSTRIRAAVNSRRHLDYQGDDGASIFERARETQERRAVSAMQAATDHMMPKASREAREEHVRSQLRSSGPRGRDMLVENAIERAHRSGAFENLEGAGKPLEAREENPYEDMSGMRVAHRILKNAGCAPAWVEQGKRIRLLLREARGELEDVWIDQLASSAFHAASPPEGEEAVVLEASSAESQWADAVRSFTDSCIAINKQITTYNLIVPGAWLHLHKLNPQSELEKAVADFELAQAEERIESMERRRKRRTAARLYAARNRKPQSPFNLGAGWALADFAMPSMFSALTAILVPGAKR